MSNKVVITCALTGVLTDPNQHPVPVTPQEMAHEARAAFARVRPDARLQVRPRPAR